MHLSHKPGLGVLACVKRTNSWYDHLKKITRDHAYNQDGWLKQVRHTTLDHVTGAQLSWTNK